MKHDSRYDLNAGCIGIGRMSQHIVLTPRITQPFSDNQHMHRKIETTINGTILKLFLI